MLIALVQLPLMEGDDDPPTYPVEVGALPRRGDVIEFGGHFYEAVHAVLLARAPGMPARRRPAARVYVKRVSLVL